MRQDILEGGKRKDVCATRGEKLKLSEQDAIKFWGGLKFSESDESNLLKIAKSRKINRLI